MPSRDNQPWTLKLDIIWCMCCVNVGCWVAVSRLCLAAPAMQGFEDNRRAVFRAPQVQQQWCASHGQLCCSVPRVDIDISGLPCTDNSQSNIRRKFEEGPTGPLFAIWARRLLTSQIPLAVLENTPATWTAAETSALSIVSC